MTGGSGEGGWKRRLRYAFGFAICALALAASRYGLQWYWSVVLLCAGVLVILGRRRIFRPGVRRTPGEVECRYVPWFEGNAYFLNIALPIFGVASIAAGFSAGNPVWLRLTGVVLLVLTPLFTSSAVRMRRRSLLRISSSSLTLRFAASRDDSLLVARECVRSIGPNVGPNGVGGRWLQVEITYQTEESTEPETILLGLQLTVEPINLLNALSYWEDAADVDPGEMMDGIELILRGGGRPAPDARTVGSPEPS